MDELLLEALTSEPIATVLSLKPDERHHAQPAAAGGSIAKFNGGANGA
jgi:hypothetical protein